MASNNKFISRNLKKGLCLLLTMCFIISILPVALATSVGSSSSAVTASSTQTFVTLTSNVNIFKTETAPSTGYVTVASGTVLMLVSTDTYTVSSTEYGCVYYNNARYNVLWSDVSSCIMSESDVETYVTGTLWKPSTYTTLRRSDNLVGNTAVYGVQRALTELGYYSSTCDGAYGKYTELAVINFQRAYGLDKDGNAGPLTEKVLFPLALAAYTGSSSDSGSDSGSSSSTSGTVTTLVNLNFRKSYSKSSALLDVVPKGTTLTYTSTRVSGSVTWYYTSYNGLNGWLMGTYVSVGSSSSSGSTTTLGTVKTLVNLNFRKSYSTSSTRLAVVPINTTLSYTATKTTSSVTWYYVNYNGTNGWLMGTYLSVNGSSGSTTTTSLGTVTATSNVVVRKTPAGSRTGYLLSKNSTATLLAAGTVSGSHTWYYVKLSNGVLGYVMGDYVTVTYDSSGGVTPSTSKTYVKLSNSVNLFTSEEQSSTGAVTVAAGKWLQLVSTETYTTNSVTYCSIYYNNTKYNCVYSDISADIQTSEELTTYITETLWPAGYSKTMRLTDDLVGDVDVHALQYALTLLGYYTGSLDGNYGSGTSSAVSNYQQAASLSVDGSAGPKTLALLYPQAITALSGGSSTVEGFGTVNTVTMTAWDFDNQGADIFAKGSTATVMDITTGKVFQVKRWSGGYHADCVPLTAADTKTMCDIVGFNYLTRSPSSSEISKISNYTNNGGTNYTWPDFNGNLTGASSIGSAWDRRAALLNVDGHVYAVSIYGWPHGYGEYSSCDAYAASNHYYGMMCIHFVNSTTHGSQTVDATHQANIVKAYNYAKTLWPTLCN